MTMCLSAQSTDGCERAFFAEHENTPAGERNTLVGGTDDIVAQTQQVDGGNRMS